MTDWIERTKQGTPVIEGETATFVWVGPEAPQLIGDWTGWQWGTPVELERAAPGVWTHTLSVEADAYLEYSFWRDGKRIGDPLNPRRVPDGLGHHNHFFYMPGAAPTPLARRRRGVPHGTITRLAAEHGFFVAGGRRTVELYRPPAAGPCPLLVVLDGQDYHPRGKIVNLVDNLIAAGRIRPLALAMVYHGRQARGIEYACSEATLAFLTGAVLELAQERLDLLDASAQPGVHGIVGASMGGLMALFAGLRAPGVFGHAISQSGAFDFADGEPVVWDLARYGPVRPVRIWMDAGRHEWLLGCNRRLSELLVGRGYDVAYHEHGGGHNYTSWRNQLWRGLELMFAP
jgi:enterochelin esterase-like enzyme